MYAVYKYLNTQTQANLLSDLVALLTGETNVNNLSAGCDKVNSTITSTEAAGWSVYDASAGTNAQCLRAPYSDDANSYKYLVVDTNTSGYVLLKVYQSWNSGTHAGTNLSYNSDNVVASQRVALASGGRLDIRATVRTCIMFSYQSSVYGTSQSSGPSGILERTRGNSWDVVGVSYTKYFFAGDMIGSAYVSTPITIGVSGADATGSSAATFSTITPFGSVGNPIPSVFIPNSTKTPAPFLLPVAFYKASAGDLGGEISSLCGVYITTYNYGSAYDTFTVSSQQYIVWTQSGSTRIAVKVA